MGEWVPNDPSQPEYWSDSYPKEMPTEINSGIFSTNVWVDSYGGLHGYKVDCDDGSDDGGDE